MKKQLQDLTKADLEDNPVWYFVGEDEQDSDELTIKPASQNEITDDTNIIVKCVFRDQKNRQFIGYINWQAPFTIEATQPIILLKESIEISFWYGLFPPKEEMIKSIKSNIGEVVFPITYESIS